MVKFVVPGQRFVTAGRVGTKRGFNYCGTKVYEVKQAGKRAGGHLYLKLVATPGRATATGYNGPTGPVIADAKEYAERWGYEFIVGLTAGPIK